MNEDIDLTEILKGCPKGTKLYSSVYGEVEFESIINIELCRITFIDTKRLIYTFYKDGKYCSNMGKCTIFPSRNQRDWSKFERFWDKPKPKIEKFHPSTLQPFDKILVRDYPDEPWIRDTFLYSVCGRFSTWWYVIPYNEETKHLIGTTDDCPDYYKWWEK